MTSNVREPVRRGCCTPTGPAGQIPAASGAVGCLLLAACMCASLGCSRTPEPHRVLKKALARTDLPEATQQSRPWSDTTPRLVLLEEQGALFDLSAMLAPMVASQREAVATFVAEETDSPNIQRTWRVRPLAPDDPASGEALDPSGLHRFIDPLSAYLPQSDRTLEHMHLYAPASLPRRR